MEKAFAIQTIAKNTKLNKIVVEISSVNDQIVQIKITGEEALEAELAEVLRIIASRIEMRLEGIEVVTPN